MNYLVALTALGGRDALGLGQMLAQTGDVTLTVCVVVPRTWDYPSRHAWTPNTPRSSTSTAKTQSPRRASSWAIPCGRSTPPARPRRRPRDSSPPPQKRARRSSSGLRAARAFGAHHGRRHRQRDAAHFPVPVALFPRGYRPSSVRGCAASPARSPGPRNRGAPSTPRYN